MSSAREVQNPGTRQARNQEFNKALDTGQARLKYIKDIKLYTNYVGVLKNTNPPIPGALTTQNQGDVETKCELARRCLE